MADRRDRQKHVTLIRAAWPQLPEATAKLWASGLERYSFTSHQIQEGIRRAGFEHDYPTAQKLVATIRLVRDDEGRKALPPPRPQVPEGERLAKCALASRIVFAAGVLGEFGEERVEEKSQLGFERLMGRTVDELAEKAREYQAKLRKARKSSALFDDALRGVLERRTGDG